MTKQEFLAMSLPYDLKCQYIGIVDVKKYKEFMGGILDISMMLNEEMWLGDKIGFLKEIHVYKKYWVARCGIYSRGLKAFLNGNDLLPILHPLSDLTKPIVHKGEAFVPAIKLAKIATNNDFINYSITIENGTIIVENIAKFSSLNMQFEIDLDNGIIDFCYCDCNGRDYPFSNQLQLFQKLVEWHFDIANLIQKGEAIDINTLEINPYK